MRKALADLDFGAVFREIRRVTKLSQETLSIVVGLDQKDLSTIETGERRLTHFVSVMRAVRGLGIPPELLDLPGPSRGTVAETEVTGLDRREFIAAALALTMGLGLRPELEWLERPPLHDTASLPHRIGMQDVVAIEQATIAWRDLDNRFGGGHFASAAYAHLNHVRTLKTADCTDDVRARLQLATTDLALTTAWMHYDTNQHLAAGKLWTIALHAATKADHPRSADLTIELLLDAAHQALHLRRPDEALRLVQAAAATVATSKYSVNSYTRAYTSSTLSWCHAQMGNIDACRRAVDEAQQIYADAEPDLAPPWATVVQPAEVIAQKGHALFLLSATDPKFAAPAIEHLGEAVTTYGDDFTRSRAVNLPGLAASQLRVGDVDAAVTTGRQAVAAIGALTSTRPHDRLRDLATIALSGPHSSRADVIDLCAAISRLVSPAA